MGSHLKAQPTQSCHPAPGTAPPYFCGKGCSVPICPLPLRHRSTARCKTQPRISTPSLDPNIRNQRLPSAAGRAGAARTQAPRLLERRPSAHSTSRNVVTGVCRADSQPANLAGAECKLQQNINYSTMKQKTAYIL